MEHEEILFSEHHACPLCGFSIGELEPRMFSFNSPFGACPDCDGLGTKLEVDPELVIPDIRLYIRRRSNCTMATDKLSILSRIIRSGLQTL